MRSNSIKPSPSSKKSTTVSLSRWRKDVNKSLSEYQTAVQQRTQEIQNKKRVLKEIEALEKTQKIIQAAAAEAQQRLHQKLASVVTRALKTVFGPDAYDFEIRFAKRRNKTEALLTFSRNGETFDPLSAAGGGVVDIASLALRVACVVTSIPKLRRFIVLDEPFRHVSLELRPVAVRLLEELATELNIQFLIVTHLAEFENLENGKIVHL